MKTWNHRGVDAENASPSGARCNAVLRSQGADGSVRPSETRFAVVQMETGGVRRKREYPSMIAGHARCSRSVGQAG